MEDTDGVGTARTRLIERDGGRSKVSLRGKIRKANSTMINYAKGECMCLVRDYAHVYATHSTAMLPITLSNSARSLQLFVAFDTTAGVPHCRELLYYGDDTRLHESADNRESYFLPCHSQLNNLKLEFPGVKLTVLKLWSLAQKVAQKYKKNA